MDSFRPAPGTLSQPLTISIRRQRSRRVDRAVPASSVSTLDYAPRLPPERGSCEPRAVSPGTPLGRGAALRQVRHVIERLLRDGTAVARSDGSHHNLFPVAVSAGEGEALREWVTREGATHTIEIGLGYGISGLFIGEALLSRADASARHVVLDPYQATRFADCGLQVLDEAGLGELVEFHAE